MGNEFINALTACDTMTENGAVSNSSTGDILVDQFGSVSGYNGRQIDKVFSNQEELWVENDLKSLQFIFYLRAISRESNILVEGEDKGTMAQKGQGLRDEVFKRLLWVAENHPKTFYANIALLPMVGSWKDIWELMWYDINLNVNVLDEEKMFALIASGLAMEKTCDLVKKYLPSMVAIKKQSTWRSRTMNVLARKFMRYMGWNHKEYRKFKTSGNAHDFQKYISQKMYDAINWSHIPGKAMTKLVASKFITKQNLLESYENWLDKQDTIKYNGYAYELGYILNHNKLYKHQKNTLNKQFDNLIQNVKKNTSFKENVWCALDTSGSMTWKYNNSNVTPYDVCSSLGVFFSTLNEGAFHKQVIMFDTTSYVKQLRGDFCQMMRQLPKNAMGGTNFLSVVKRIVKIRKDNPSIPLEDYPTTLLVVSDMQFNATGGVDTNYERCKTMLLEVFPQEFVNNFKFVWWNVATTTRDFPSRINDGGTFLLSGFDGSVISLLLGEELTEKTKKKPQTMQELVDVALSQEVFSLLKIVK
jgi:hypothetical protein